MTAFPHLKPAKGLLPAVGQSRDHGPSKRKYSDYHEYFPKRTNESFPLIQVCETIDTSKQTIMYGSVDGDVFIFGRCHANSNTHNTFIIVLILVC